MGFKSIAQLERDMYLTGCQKDNRSFIEYRMSLNESPVQLVNTLTILCMP